MSADYCLHAPGSILNGQKRAFHKFTPFYEAALDLSVDAPKRAIQLSALSKTTGKRLSHKIGLDEAKHVFVGNRGNAQLAVHGGRPEGLKQLSKALRDQHDYAKTRDYMAHETSMLSAHLKFGTVSVREVYHTFLRKYGKHHELLRQLIWRDFFVHLLFFYPENLEHMYSKQYERIRWSTSTSDLEAWKSGHTGFPLVDAAMRQLNATGYMHNRGRMLVANFLVKTLLLDWREGERYFAQKLTDYDVGSNLGNWQSIVGGGAYAGAWFRDMNPWIQSKKFDPDAAYIKKWVPELTDVPAKDIHRWNVVYQDKYKGKTAYPSTIVDYSEQKKKFFELYRKYL
jgi:deoxyribodipyrimidine photo-lyase